MEKKNISEKKQKKLGEKALRFLHLTLPLVLLQAVGTAIYIALAEPYRLICEAETVYFMLDWLGLALMLSVLGSLFYDLLEKRSSDQ